jgi:acetyltransferase-like isoleucine patch superfamily enzyme
MFMNILKIIKLVIKRVISQFRSAHPEEKYTKNRLTEYMKKGLAEVGEYSYGCPKIFHYGEKTKLIVGKFCSISTNVNIFLGGNHRHDWVTTYPFSVSEFNKIWPEASNIKGHPATKGNVVIGNDVWIGYGATIMSGVKIGDGAVIGSMAVVSKDVRPYAIVVGNPAKEVRRRFSEQDIDDLLKLQWWNWPIEKIKKNVTLLCSNNINLLKIK